MADEKNKDCEPPHFPETETLPAVLREKLLGFEQNIMTRFESMLGQHEALHERLEKGEDAAAENSRQLLDLRRDIERNNGKYVNRVDMVAMFESQDRKNEAVHKALRTEIDDLKIAKANLDGRFWTLGVIVTVLSVAMPLIVAYIRKQ